jgi:hypothetical protein
MRLGYQKILRPSAARHDSQHVVSLAFIQLPCVLLGISNQTLHDARCPNVGPNRGIADASKALRNPEAVVEAGVHFNFHRFEGSLVARWLKPQANRAFGSDRAPGVARPGLGARYLLSRPPQWADWKRRGVRTGDQVVAEKHDDGVWEPSFDRAQRVKEWSMSSADFGPYPRERRIQSHPREGADNLLEDRYLREGRVSHLVPAIVAGGSAARVDGIFRTHFWGLDWFARLGK